MYVNAAHENAAAVLALVYLHEREREIDRERERDSHTMGNKKEALHVRQCSRCNNVANGQRQHTKLSTDSI